MQQNEAIAIVLVLRKNAGSGRDNDIEICTYDLSKFAVVAVEKLGKIRSTNAPRSGSTKERLTRSSTR